MLQVDARNVYTSCPDRINLFFEVERLSTSCQADVLLTDMVAIYVLPVLRQASSERRFLLYCNSLTKLQEIYACIEDVLGSQILIDSAKPDAPSNRKIACFTSLHPREAGTQIARALCASDSGLLGVVASPALGMG